MTPNTDISIVWGVIVLFAACEEPMLVMFEYLLCLYKHDFLRFDSWHIVNSQV